MPCVWWRGSTCSSVSSLVQAQAATRQLVWAARAEWEITTPWTPHPQHTGETWEKVIRDIL